MTVSESMAFLTPEEMAVKLHISIRKLQQMMKDNCAPEHIRLGAKVLFVMKKEANHA